MDNRESLQRTLARARRTLQFLEQQAVRFGLLHIPANLQIELEEKREDAARLEARMAEATSQPQARIAALDTGLPLPRHGPLPPQGQLVLLRSR